MRRLYFDLSPHLQNRADRSGQSRHLRSWLRQIHQAAVDLLDGIEQPRKLLDLLSQGNDYELVTLTPLYSCATDRRIRHEAHGECPICYAPLQPRPELNREALESSWHEELVNCTVPNTGRLHGLEG